LLASLYYISNYDLPHMIDKMPDGVIVARPCHVAYRLAGASAAHRHSLSAGGTAIVQKMLVKLLSLPMEYHRQINNDSKDLSRKPQSAACRVRTYMCWC